MRPGARLLLLGGTEEGRLLAQRLQRCPGLELFHSLAGRTSPGGGLAGRLRRGGFGGACGLARWLRANEIDLLLDATHLYAARISRHAALAAMQCGIARAQLRRAAWTPEQGDRWRSFDSLECMARQLPAGARVFLSLGSGGLEAFRRRRDVFFLARCIEPPGFADGLGFGEHFPGGHLLLGRGPFGLQEELDLLRQWRIDMVASRNSGGAATRAKIIAARRLGLPVWMPAPPPPLPGVRLDSVEAAERWVRRRLRLNPCAGGAGHAHARRRRGGCR